MVYVLVLDSVTVTEGEGLGDTRIGLIKSPSLGLWVVQSQQTIWGMGKE